VYPSEKGKGQIVDNLAYCLIHFGWRKTLRHKKKRGEFTLLEISLLTFSASEKQGKEDHQGGRERNRNRARSKKKKRNGEKESRREKSRLSAPLGLEKKASLVFEGGFDSITTPPPITLSAGGGGILLKYIGPGDGIWAGKGGTTRKRGTLKQSTLLPERRQGKNRSKDSAIENPVA